MNEEILQQAIQLYKQGDKKQAAGLLVKIIKQEPKNADAWYSLSLCVEEKEQKIYCLRKAVEANPTHQKSLQDLDKLYIGQKSDVINHQNPKQEN